MELESLVKDVVELRENVKVVEFSNGYAAAYEQTHERLARVNERRQVVSYEEGSEIARVSFALLSENDYPMCGGHNAQQLPSLEYTGFSNTAKDDIDEYVKRRTTTTKDLEKKANGLYEDLCAQLGIVEKKRPQWSEIGLGFTMSVLGWPMLMYSMIKGERTGSAGCALALGPFLLPFAIATLVREITNPSECYSKIQNTSLLTKNPSEDSVGLVFGSGLGKPKDFTSLEFYLPAEGISLSHGFIRKDEKTQRAEDWYRDNVKHYATMPKELLSKVRQCSLELESERTRYYEFAQELRMQDHQGVLQRIGFGSE